MKKADQALIDLFVDKMTTEFDDMGTKTAKSFLEKAVISKEIEPITEENIENWYENIFKEHMFIIDEKTYLNASIQALKIQFTMAGTDFGSSRQRDLGQKWSDTIRGYLGEFGVQQYFHNKWDIEIDLGHEEGALADYLPTDIHKIKLPGEDEQRNANLNVSIKTTKSNGIWLDIPGDQYHHSDIYILAKIGIGTDHLFSFFKHISVFKDKILKCGQDEGCINEEEADEIFEKIPSFSKIYGYVPGFINSDDTHDTFTYEGKKGRKNYKIYNWTGKFEQEYLNQIRTQEDLVTSAKVTFEGIGSFSQSNRYIFGMKSLKNTEADWKTLVIEKI